MYVDTQTYLVSIFRANKSQKYIGLTFVLANTPRVQNNSVSIGARTQGCKEKFAIQIMSYGQSSADHISVFISMHRLHRHDFHLRFHAISFEKKTKKHREFLDSFVKVFIQQHNKKHLCCCILAGSLLWYFSGKIPLAIISTAANKLKRIKLRDLGDFYAQNPDNSEKTPEHKWFHNNKFWPFGVVFRYRIYSERYLEMNLVFLFPENVSTYPLCRATNFNGKILRTKLLPSRALSRRALGIFPMKLPHPPQKINMSPQKGTNLKGFILANVIFLGIC